MNRFAALSDSTRLRIVELLGGGERTAGAIGEHFPVSAPAISQHLKTLREAGLVQVRVDGQRRIYSLDPEGFAEMESWFANDAGLLERPARHARAGPQQRRQGMNTMTTDYGIITEAGAIRFERLLPGPIERVWEYLVDSELRRTWLAQGPMELRPGGTVQMTWRNSELAGTGRSHAREACLR